MQKIYDSWGARYGRWTAVLDRNFLNRMRESVLGGRSGEILEIAVGDGKNLRYYDRKSRVVGVDLSPVMLDLARRNAAGLGVDFEGHVSDVSQLQFRDASFDFVSCTLGGCTFGDPDRVFAEMRRVLRPGGRALFVEHVRPRSRIGQAMANAVTPITSRLLGCHPNRDTGAALLRAGFTFERVDSAVGGILLGIVAERGGA